LVIFRVNDVLLIGPHRHHMLNLLESHKLTAAAAAPDIKANEIEGESRRARGRKQFFVRLCEIKACASSAARQQ
jgi:uncharacterized protein (DUF2147 family)